MPEFNFKHSQRGLKPAMFRAVSDMRLDQLKNMLSQLDGVDGYQIDLRPAGRAYHEVTVRARLLGSVLTRRAMKELLENYFAEHDWFIEDMPVEPTYVGNRSRR